MGLLKKKAGGTFFGNLLRAGASKATDGVFGTGGRKIEFGQVKTNAQLAADQGRQYDGGKELFINDLIPPDQTNTLYWIIGGMGVFILAVIAYTQGLFKQKKSWGRR